MKKLILLAIVLLIVPFIRLTSKNRDAYKNYPQLEKNEKWEYVKERVNISQYASGPAIWKYSGPILCKLYNASSKDSLAINNVFKNLKGILPNKEFNYFENYTGLNFGETNAKDTLNGYLVEDLKEHMLSFSFEEKEGAILSKNEINKDGRFFVFSLPRQLKNITKIVSGFIQPKIKFYFDQNTLVNERADLINYELVRLISGFNSRDDMFPKKRTVNSEESILNSNKRNYRNQKLSKLDTFLLQNLYSDNFMDKFSSYLYKTYPLNYVCNYIAINKTQMFAVWICIILAITFLIIGFSILYKKTYKYSYFDYFIIILFIIISAFYIFKLYKYITDINDFDYWLDFILIHVAFAIFASIIALVLFVFDTRFIKPDMSFTSKIILKTGFSFLIATLPIVLVFIAENNNKPWYVLNPLLLLAFGITLARGLLIYLNNFSENLIKQKDVELSHLKALNSEAEVKLLQSQINPHFLYNALNSIASLAQTDGVKTEKMALSLSDLFKYSINRKGKKNSTIGDEVDMVNNYLEVEQVRFGDRLNFNIHVDENLETLKIPMFLIQPLIENAVKHGISKVENHGEIVLKIIKNNSDLMISVQDNGPDFPDGLVSGHGLQTVFDLLRLSYNNDATLSWTNTPKKEITITIKNII